MVEPEPTVGTVNEGHADVVVSVDELSEILAIRVAGGDLSAIRRCVLEVAARLTGARRAMLLVREGTLRTAADVVVDRDPSAAALPPEAREDLAIRAMEEGRPVVAEARSGCAAAAAPVTMGRGAVVYAEGPAMPGTPRQACLLGLLADRLSIAELHHGRERVGDAGGLAAPVLAAVRAESPDPLVVLCDVARGVLGATAAAVLVVDDEGGATVASAVGVDPATAGLSTPPGFADVRSLAIPGRTGEAIGTLRLFYQVPGAAPSMEPLVVAVAAAVLEIGRAHAESAAREDHGRTEKTRALAVLAGGVSHEFNNLLAIILGKTQLALQRGETGDLRSDLAVIEQTAWRAADTVRRLQTFVAGRSDERVTTVEVDRLVRDVLTFTEPIWRDDSDSRGVPIELHAELAAGTSVAGRVGELQEALTNLVRNAVDAMPRGGRITVATRSRAGTVEVSVSDTGEGISPDDRTRIFDPFFTTRSPLRAGLGLSVVQGIAARHGGRVEVRSQPGRGTTLMLTLPESDPDGVTSGGESAARAAQAPRGGSVLVVEDEHHLRRLLLDTLYAAGHDVEGAVDGPDGIRRFESGRHDVVVTDLSMPGCSGLEVARAVKAHRPGTPVLMVTGWGDLLDLDAIRQRQIDLVLVKPFTMERVRAAVAEALARPRPD